MIVLIVGYPSGVPFDEQYYFTRHLPFADRLMRPLSQTKVEVARVAPVSNGSTPRYQIITSVYFESARALEAAMVSPAQRDVMADMPNYFGGTPEVFIADLLDLPAGSSPAATP